MVKTHATWSREARSTARTASPGRRPAWCYVTRSSDGEAELLHGNKEPLRPLLRVRQLDTKRLGDLRRNWAQAGAAWSFPPRGAWAV